MNILAIDTSCDDTSVAVTNGRRILSNELFSQISIHKDWGGVVPNLAKRAHEERIDEVVASALEKAGVAMEDIDAVAVTQGPGLAIALGVGIDKAKELAEKYGKRLIAVNHMEGHIYSCFAQDIDGQPEVPFEFPYLVLLVSGGHTELVLFKDHLLYIKVGATRDDAAGEAIDKAARLIIDDKAYPGGPLLEALAQRGSPSWLKFPIPMTGSDTLDFSYSGLKTALLYKIQSMSAEEIEEHRADLAACFQEAVFGALFMQLKKAMKKYDVRNLVVGGGVVANQYLRVRISEIIEEVGGSVQYPKFSGLAGDNAAMIGIAAHYYAEAGRFVDDPDTLERNARMSL
jgi:N6-L-threonylcarbamoyladenine synthase